MSDPIDYEKCRTQRPALYIVVWAIWFLLAVGGVLTIAHFQSKLDALQPCVQQVSK
jgi:hypothetical protein